MVSIICVVCLCFWLWLVGGRRLVIHRHAPSVCLCLLWLLTSPHQGNYLTTSSVLQLNDTQPDHKNQMKWFCLRWTISTTWCVSNDGTITPRRAAVQTVDDAQHHATTSIPFTSGPTDENEASYCRHLIVKDKSCHFIISSLWFYSLHLLSIHQCLLCRRLLLLLRCVHLQTWSWTD